MRAGSDRARRSVRIGKIMELTDIRELHREKDVYIGKEITVVYFLFFGVRLSMKQSLNRNFKKMSVWILQQQISYRQDKEILWVINIWMEPLSP